MSRGAVAQTRITPSAVPVTSLFPSGVKDTESTAPPREAIVTMLCPEDASQMRAATSSPVAT